ncbi:MAG TPA: dienelactone hydrolase family protein [Caulobacterales bacterium]|nr:dienelactone hydrolase family protein [Caulobacterales bacterium]
MADWVEVKGPDGAFKAYLARPTAPAKAAVVLIQEIFGVNHVMRHKADWLAGEGFLALCPDLFWRLEPGVDITDKTEAEWSKAFDLMKRFDQEAGLRDIQATITHARSLGAAKVGDVGYCLGGRMAYLTACHTDADASVGYYGVGIENKLDDARGLKKPLMLHIADKDGFSSKEAIAQIDAGLGSNPLVTMHHYAEQDHAFSREGGKNYDATAAAVANARTLAFFRQNLA